MGARFHSVIALIALSLPVLISAFQACAPLRGSSGSEGASSETRPVAEEEPPLTPEVDLDQDNLCQTHPCFYAATDGSAEGSGSEAEPWDLQTALRQPPTLIPGSILYLRGGTYRGYFLSELRGTSDQPIVVAGFPGETPVLDASDPSPQNFAALTVRGEHTWFTNFEVTNTNPERVFPLSSETCFERQHCRRPGVDVFGPGTRIINLVIHDTGVGLSLWNAAVGAHAYGNIIFYSGWQGQFRGSGHGLYTQNESGQRFISDNFIFSSFHSGIHAYGTSESTVRNITFRGNIIFGNGLLAEDPNGWGILVGGNALTENISIEENYLYNPAEFSRSNNLDPSYGGGTRGLNLRSNFSVGSKAFDFVVAPSDFSASDNSFFGLVGANPTTILNNLPSNQRNRIDVFDNVPGQAFLRRNPYHSRRAHLAVFAGAGNSRVLVDLSSFLSINERYVIRDVQNYFGSPVRTATYVGPFEMDLSENNPIASPVGNPPRPPSRIGLGRFGAFVVEKLR